MISKLIEKLADWNIKYNKWLIIFSIVVSVFLAIFIKNLYFDNDMQNYVSADSKIGYLPHYISKTFGNTTPTLLMLKFDDCFTYDNLSLVKEISDEIKKLKGIETVLSLADIDDVVSTKDGVKVQNLISFPLPKDESYYRDLKKYVLSKKSYVRTVISPDAATAMFIVKPAAGQRSDVISLDVKKKVQALIAGKNVKLYVGGMPAFMNSITEIVSKDFIFLIPLVILSVVAVLFISFRTLRGVALPLLSVLFATLMAMGLMGLLHIPLNAMSVAIPIVLIAVGNAYGIHVLNRYYEKVSLFKDKADVIRWTLREISLPILISGLTAVFGFVSLATAQITVIKDFGIYTGAGILFATFISLAFIPSYLYRSKTQKCFRMQMGENNSVKIGKTAQFMTNLVTKHSKALVIGFLVLSVIGVICATRLTSKVDYLAYFEKKSEPNVVADFTIKNFGGYYPYHLYVKGDITEPDILKMLLISEEKAFAYTHMKASGVPDLITELNRAMTGVKSIPETKQEVENLWFFMEGKDALSSMVTRDKKEAMSTCMIASLDVPFIHGLQKEMGDYIGGFTNGINAIANSPGNPELTEIEKLFIGNLLGDKKIDVSKDGLNDLVNSMTEAAKSFVPNVSPVKLTAYMTGDESEIALKAPQAAAIASSMNHLSALTVDEAVKAVRRTIPNTSKYSDEDVQALSKSLISMINEESRSQRIDHLIKAFTNKIPAAAVIPAEDLNYAVAPYTWATIPVKKTAGIVPVHQTAVLDVQQTGFALLAEELRQEVIRDQIISLSITLILVLIFNALVFRSFKEGLVSMIAMPFTLIVNYAVMALFNIPLDMVTVTVGSISIIGIDYTIHFIARYSIEMKKNGHDKVQAFAVTFATAGKAIVFNALSVGIGFAVLCFSSIITLRSLGFLLCVTMLVSCATSLTLLPAVLFSGNLLAKGEE